MLVAGLWIWYCWTNIWAMTGISIAKLWSGFIGNVSITTLTMLTLLWKYIVMSLYHQYNVMHAYLSELRQWHATRHKWNLNGHSLVGSLSVLAWFNNIKKAWRGNMWCIHVHEWTIKEYIGEWDINILLFEFLYRNLLLQKNTWLVRYQEETTFKLQWLYRN